MKIKDFIDSLGARIYYIEQQPIKNQDVIFYLGHILLDFIDALSDREYKRIKIHIQKIFDRLKQLGSFDPDNELETFIMKGE
jgi:hypothetical protein